MGGEYNFLSKIPPLSEENYSTWIEQTKSLLLITGALNSVVYDVEEATLSPYLRSVSNAWKEEAATITILRVSREGGSVGGVNSPQDCQSGDSTSASSSALVEDTKSPEGLVVLPGG